MKYPMAPLVLGLVLGDILDKSLRRGLVLTDGGLGPFFTRPISLVLWLDHPVDRAAQLQDGPRAALGRLCRAARPAEETDG